MSEYSEEDLNKLIEAILQVRDANVELLAAIKEVQESISALAAIAP